MNNLRADISYVIDHMPTIKQQFLDAKMFGEKVAS